MSEHTADWLRTFTGNLQVREVLIASCASRLATWHGKTAEEAQALAEGVWQHCLYQAKGEMSDALGLMREEIKRLEQQIPDIRP
jgi:hypothetical protein